MHIRFALAALACLAAGACTGVARLGSPSLTAKPSAHLDAAPFELISAQLHASPVFTECAAMRMKPGPSANLDASLIPSDEYVQQGRRAQALIEPYSFSINLGGGVHKGEMLQVSVPAGFVSDFHSMPDAAVGITLSVRKALEAAVIHDWLYAVGRQGDSEEKHLADQAYSDILAHYGVDGFTHFAVASGVRMGGRKSFGAANELRFYNKCFYGQCPGQLGPWPELLQSPVMALKPDETLRAELWDLTVCLAKPKKAAEIAALAQ
jgi:hypothetical protein